MIEWQRKRKRPPLDLTALLVWVAAIAFCVGFWLAIAAIIAHTDGSIFMEGTGQ